MRTAAAARPANPRLAEALAIAHMARAADSLNALRAVSRLNLPHELGPLARVICEAGIQLAWLSHTKGESNSADTSESRAQDLLDGANFIAERNARMWAANGFCSVDDAKSLAERLRAVQERRREQGLPAATEPVLANMATSAGPVIAEGYNLYFRTLCDSAHASVWASAAAASGSEPSEEVHSRTLFIALSCGVMVRDFAGQLLAQPEGTGHLLAELGGILGIELSAAPPTSS